MGEEYLCAFELYLLFKKLPYWFVETVVSNHAMIRIANQVKITRHLFVDYRQQ